MFPFASQARHRHSGLPVFPFNALSALTMAKTSSRDFSDGAETASEKRLAEQLLCRVMNG